MKTNFNSLLLWNITLENNSLNTYEYSFIISVESNSNMFWKMLVMIKMLYWSLERKENLHAFKTLYFSPITPKHVIKNYYKPLRKRNYKIYSLK